MHIENLVVSYYVKALPTDILMWVKKAKKETIQVTFKEVIFIGKDILGLRDNPKTQSYQASPSRKKFETSSKPPSTKKEHGSVDIKSLHMVLNNLSNNIIDPEKK